MQKQKSSQGLNGSAKSSSLAQLRLSTARKLCLAVMMLAGVSGMPAVAGVASFVARATSVPDGDTLWVQSEAGGSARKLRLLGIDAPEICQQGGLDARDALRALVADKRLRVTVKYQDDYGRGLARIMVDDQDVGALLVRQGQAWSSRWRHSLGPYAPQESEARLAGKGLFGRADAELPRDFRQRYGSCYVADAEGVLHLR